MALWTTWLPNAIAMDAHELGGVIHEIVAIQVTCPNDVVAQRSVQPIGAFGKGVAVGK